MSLYSKTDAEREAERADDIAQIAKFEEEERREAERAKRREIGAAALWAAVDEMHADEWGAA